MLKPLTTWHTTLARDFTVLLSRRSFWGLLALWTALSAVIFFAYLEDFLAIQPSLRAKNFRYGVTDMVLLPYLKLLGSIAIIVMAGLCSRLFYQECFAPFSAIFRSTRPNAFAVTAAKIVYIKLLAALLLLLLALPVIGSGLFMEYNGFRIVVTLLACFMVLLLVGVLSMLLSQIFAHSVVVMLITVVIILVPELIVRLLVEPTWLAPIIAFFSPLAHLNRITTGVVSVSDVIFFLGLVLLLFFVAVRQFNNTYLSIS